MKSSESMQVESAEEKVHQFVAYVNTGTSKLEIFRMAEEVVMGVNEGESESLEGRRSGDEEQEST